MLLGRLQQQPLHLAGRRTIGSADADRAADDVVGKRPIDDARFQQLAVGNDNLVVRPVRDFGAPRANLRDRAGPTIELDHIADANGALGQEDQAADEIIDDKTRAPDPHGVRA